MSYMPFTPVIPSDKSKKAHYYTLPQGVRLRKDMSETDEGFGLMTNFVPNEKSLQTRPALKCLAENIYETGEVHGYSKVAFCGKCIFHIGQNLYTFSPDDNECTVLFGQMPDKRSVFCHFMSKLYIYCDCRVFCLDDTLGFSECEPDAPILYDKIKTFGINPKRNDKAINLITTRIGVSYITTDTTYFKLPLLADTSRPMKVIVNEAVLASDKYTFDEESITISKSSSSSDDKDLVVYYYVKNPDDIGFDDTIYRCECVTSFGGSVGGGTRLFFSGDANKKGSYYKSELQNPLNVPADSEEIVGDGCENVTAMIKMYGALIILCENSVYRMDYNLTQDGVYFTCKQISYGRGCDMPGSVQLVDNRVVFANSKEGLFIIDSTDEAGEHNIKPIGSNILKGQEMGFLDIDLANRTNAQSLDFDRKYYLFAGDMAYIWDYDKSHYSDNGNYAKSSGKLSWYIYDGLMNGTWFDMGTDICLLAVSHNAFYSFSLDEMVDFTSKIRSGDMDFGEGNCCKFVEKISVFLTKDSESDAELTVFCDGQAYYTQSLVKVCGKMHRLDIILPKKRLYKFGFMLETNGKMCIESINIEYRILSK